MNLSDYVLDQYIQNLKYRTQYIPGTRMMFILSR